MVEALDLHLQGLHRDPGTAHQEDRREIHQGVNAVQDPDQMRKMKHVVNDHEIEKDKITRAQLQPACRPNGEAAH